MHICYREKLWSYFISVCKVSEIFWTDVVYVLSIINSVVVKHCLRVWLWRIRSVFHTHPHSLTKRQELEIYSTLNQQQHQTWNEIKICLPPGKCAFWGKNQVLFKPYLLPVFQSKDSFLLSSAQDLHIRLVSKDSGGLKQKLCNKEGEGE